MKRGYLALACTAIFVLFLAAPLLAQEAVVEDEEIIMLAADTDQADPPAAQGAAPSGKQPAPERKGYFHHGKMVWMAHFLNLSKEQLAKSREIWRRYFMETHNLRYAIMAKRVELEKVFTDPKADAATLVAMGKEMSVLRQQLAERRMIAVAEWRSILTPEQIEKIDFLITIHHKMGWKKMGWHEEKGGCDCMGQGMMGSHPMGPHMMGRETGGPGMMGGEMTGEGMPAGAMEHPMAQMPGEGPAAAAPPKE
jgi:Spy/CpxP family protein refolding chaperone